MRRGVWCGVVALLLAVSAHPVMGADENPAANWIARNAISLTSVTAAESFEDLLPLIPLFKSARIIAIGEGTHGTREFFTVRHRLIAVSYTHLTLPTN